MSHLREVCTMSKKRKPRQREPFFRKDRQLWYVQIDGKQVNLGPDRDAAWKRYHELMAERGKSLPAEPAPPPGTGVIAILERFMDHVQRTRSLLTYDFYQ